MYEHYLYLMYGMYHMYSSKSPTTTKLLLYHTYDTRYDMYVLRTKYEDRLYHEFTQ